MHVLVTRPEPGSARTAALLQSRGYQPLVLPLTRTVPLTENHDLLQRTPAAAYIATSGAALRHWRMTGLLPDQLVIPFYAVGEATGNLALDAGFSDVRVGPGDGDALAGTILRDVEARRLQVSESAPLVYVAGRVRRSRLENQISVRKLPLRVVDIYDTQKISYSPDYFLKQFESKSPIAVFLYSHHGAAMLVEHLLHDDSDKIMKKCIFLCLSNHVASAIPAQFEAQIHVAGAPNEADLLDQLDRLSDAS